ncbi:uncharacterized protein BDW47DRAFT_12063 [Aspergillus candidus]|uniref:Life-span regulatory factor-domain-containing protein n=1 Tax=Aspergillus candidus TaxID=41067 RepID=A0A2I2FGG4_ASPCN|nr:hypothetical protein BDW47DRAFT_12063 [Aspergillus candidus]PLB39726.1 hypothetical protein BDW47DRAFT_12063 [Aspergillus candidus]
MAQGHHSSHHRRSPSGSNAAKVKPARPALHRKGTSSVNHSISKLGAAPVKQTTVDHTDDEEFEMAASFLNFCAMCERQITVPDNSLLYCSQSCRRKDSHKPLSASISSSSSMSAPTSPPASPPMSPRTIVPPMVPTKAPVYTPARLSSEMYEVQVDQDPSEWKPVIPIPGSAASSEAWTYLSQFHGTQAPIPVRRKADHHSSGSLSTLSATGAPPSLIHTPSSVASSLSSSASDYMSHRPLPPRHKFSGSTSGTKGVELVVPLVDEPRGLSTDVNGGSIFPANSAVWKEPSSTPVTIVGKNSSLPQ